MRYMNLRHQLARVENAAPFCRGGKCETWIYGTRLQGWKMRDMKMRDQIAGVETAGKVSMESQSVKKVSQSSCICVQSYSFSISLLDKWCETELYWIIGQDYYSLWRHIRQHTNTQIQKKTWNTSKRQLISIIDETTYDQLCRYCTGMPCYVWR